MRLAREREELEAEHIAEQQRAHKKSEEENKVGGQVSKRTTIQTLFIVPSSDVSMHVPMFRIFTYVYIYLRERFMTNTHGLHIFFVGSSFGRLIDG